MLDIFIANRLGPIVALKIVIAIGKAEAALDNNGGNFGAILEILSGSGVKKCIHAKRVQTRNLVLQRFLIVYFGNAGKFRLQRLQSFGFDLRLVHAGRIIVADFLFAASFWRFGIPGGSFQYFAQ